MSSVATKTVRVTNIAPQATRDQMQTLFGFIGKIDDIRLYPTVRDVAVPVVSRVSFIRFADPLLADVALHMTNTVFIDRALIVMPFYDEIPEEGGAMEALSLDNGLVGVLNDGELPPHVSNVIDGAYYITRDPAFAENGIPDYPNLSCTLEYGEVEEIRRTIVIGNLPPETETSKVVDFMSSAGEVKYARMCGRSSDESRACLMEFSEQPSVLAAMKMAGTSYRGRSLTMAHSRLPILKPQIKTNEMAQREIEEAMRRTQEQQTLMTPSTQPQTSYMDPKRRSRTRSPYRRSSRNDSYRSKRRSRSRERGRRSRSRDRSRRSRSRDRSRRSRSRERVRRSRSRDRSRRSKSRERRRSRSRDRSRRSRSRDRRDRARSRRSRSKDKKHSSSRDKRHGGSREREPRAASQDVPGSAPPPADHDDVEPTATVSSAVPEKRSSRSASPKAKHSRSRSPVARKSSRRSRSRSRGHRRSRSPHLSRKRSRSPRARRSSDRSGGYRRERKRERHSSRDRQEGRSGRRVVRDYDEEEQGYDEPEMGSGVESPSVSRSSKYSRSSRKRGDDGDMSD